MKKINLLKASLLILAFVFSTIGNAFAIPTLQLYIEGSTYDSGTETWTTPSSSFILWAIGNISGPGGTGNIEDVFIAAAYDHDQSGTITLTPTTATLLPDVSTPVDVPPPTTFTNGSRPVMSGGRLLPGHDIYGIGTDWQKFSLGDFTLSDSPMGDFIDGYPTPTSFTANAGQINAYRVDITGYSSVHFDLYDHIASSTKAEFAPFSHDAEGGGSPVPEPATMTLLGLGLAGLLGFRKRS